MCEKRSHFFWEDIPVEFSDSQGCVVQQITQDLRRHMSAKPKRLAHSLGCAKCAYQIASVYTQDTFCAYIAGLLHDWDKIYTNQQLIEKAQALHIDMAGAAFEDVCALLHGKTAVYELRTRYPFLDDKIFKAIAVHTTADIAMSDFDKVVFIADALEPTRQIHAHLCDQKALVATNCLDDVFWRVFCDGIRYVIQTNRYIWPKTIEIYNTLCKSR